MAVSSRTSRANCLLGVPKPQPSSSDNGGILPQLRTPLRRRVLAVTASERVRLLSHLNVFVSTVVQEVAAYVEAVTRRKLQQLPLVGENADFVEDDVLEEDDQASMRQIAAGLSAKPLEPPSARTTAFVIQSVPTSGLRRSTVASFASLQCVAVLAFFVFVLLRGGLDCACPCVRDDFQLQLHSRMWMRSRAWMGSQPPFSQQMILGRLLQLSSVALLLPCHRLCSRSLLAIIWLTFVMGKYAV